MQEFEEKEFDDDITPEEWEDPHYYALEEELNLTEDDDIDYVTDKRLMRKRLSS